MTRRFRTGVLEKLRPEIVFSDVMIDNKLSACESPQDFRHRTELCPSTSIEDDQAISFDLVWMNAFSKHTDILSRVEKSQGWWSWMTVDDRHFLAHRLQDSRHANLTPQRIAIGPYVAGQDETAVRAEDRNQTVPSE